MAIRFLLVLFLLAGCGSKAVVHSFTDPGHSTAYESVMVVAVGMTLSARSRAEHAATGVFMGHGIQATRGMRILPPTRHMAVEEVVSIIRGTGTQSVLLLGIRSEDLQTTLYLSDGTGGTVTKPVAEYTAQLVDVSSGQVVWTADISGYGTKFATFPGLAGLAAQRTAERLVADGLLR